MIYKECVLKNCDWVIGLVLSTSGSSEQFFSYQKLIKFDQLDIILNKINFILFLQIIVFSIVIFLFFQ